MEQEVADIVRVLDPTIEPPIGIKPTEWHQKDDDEHEGEGKDDNTWHRYLRRVIC